MDFRTTYCSGNFLLISKNLQACLRRGLFLILSKLKMWHDHPVPLTQQNNCMSYSLRKLMPCHHFLPGLWTYLHKASSNLNCKVPLFLEHLRLTTYKTSASQASRVWQDFMPTTSWTFLSQSSTPLNRWLGKYRGFSNKPKTFSTLWYNSICSKISQDQLSLLVLWAQAKFRRTLSRIYNEIFNHKTLMSKTWCSSCSSKMPAGKL